MIESSFGKARKAAKKAAKKAANAAKKAMPLKGSEKGLPKGIVKTGKKELSIIIQPKPLKTRDYKQTLDQVKSLKYKGSPAWRLAAHGLGKFVGNPRTSLLLRRINEVKRKNRQQKNTTLYDYNALSGSATRALKR